MLLAHQTLFDSEHLNIRLATARPSASPISDLEHARADLLLFPIAGLFAWHDSPGRHVVANANHALLLGHGQSYRVSFPGGIGDDCLVLRFSTPALTSMLAETAGTEDLHSPSLDTHCLLSAASVLDRELLQRRLMQGAADALAIEEICMSLFSAAVEAAHKDRRRKDRGKPALTMSRRQRQVETVKELISLQPAREWTLSELGREAAASPCHLARIFREEVGVPVHQYLLRTRIGKALETMRTEDTDLTTVALDAGFAHHSHFTATFHALFGTTPSRFRKGMQQARCGPGPV